MAKSGSTRELSNAGSANANDCLHLQFHPELRPETEMAHMNDTMGLAVANGRSRVMTPHVFGIGLHKTGTTSLHEALRILGWNSLHNATLAKERIQEAQEDGRPLLSGLSEFNAFSDYPFPNLYRTLDELYPDAKFILTTRTYDSWLESRRNHNGRTIHWTWDKDTLEREWVLHHQKVDEYFRHSDRLLKWSPCNGDGWGQLCEFLDVPVPEVPFPHEKRRAFIYAIQDSFSHRIPLWKEHFEDTAGTPKFRALEIGSLEGRSAVWTLFNLCSADDARLTCVDPWWKAFVEHNFDRNIAATGMSHKLRKVKKRSCQAQFGVKEFDFIYVDGSHEGHEVLLDGLRAIDWLKVGGHLVFDDYGYHNPERHHQPKEAIDVFLKLNDYRIEVLHKDWQVIVRRTA